MNKRIQELALQAIANVGFWRGCNQESYVVEEYELEKFAQLIVQECVRHFNEDYKRDFMVSWRKDLSDSILNHFGIEK